MKFSIVSREVLFWNPNLWKSTKSMWDLSLIIFRNFPWNPSVISSQISLLILFLHFSQQNCFTIFTNVFCLIHQCCFSWRFFEVSFWISPKVSLRIPSRDFPGSAPILKLFLMILAGLHECAIPRVSNGFIAGFLWKFFHGVLAGVLPGSQVFPILLHSFSWGYSQNIHIVSSTASLSDFMDVLLNSFAKPL